MKHTISVTVANRFGVLARVSGLFSSRGYNIESLAVGVTQDPDISRMTIVVKGDDKILEQVIKQLNKLVDVIEVTDLRKGSYVSRELLLIKVKCSSRKRTEVLEINNVFRGKVVDVGLKSVNLLITGKEEKIKAFIRLMEPYGILEIARTGRVAMTREESDDQFNNEPENNIL